MRHKVSGPERPMSLIQDPKVSPYLAIFLEKLLKTLRRVVCKIRFRVQSTDLSLLAATSTRSTNKALLREPNRGRFCESSMAKDAATTQGKNPHLTEEIYVSAVLL